MTTPLSGTFLLEDCATIASGVRNGDWLEGGMGALGAVADAGTNSNFLPGSYTALKHDGVVDLTPTREFVIDGGIRIPPGSILFQIKPDGTKEILGVFT